MEKEKTLVEEELRKLLEVTLQLECELDLLMEKK